MERTGRWQRFWGWQPQTYLQVWLLAVITFGTGGLILWAALRMQDSAVLRTQAWWLGVETGVEGIAIFGSGLSWQMYRRRREDR